jgi:endonuclease YncB( thermonuclease family)
MCTDTVGKTWDCGKKAKDALTRMIRQHSISCFHIDGEFEDGVPIVTCISGRLDLAREMVVIGLSKSLHDQNKRYELEERDAKRAKRGLWK